MKVVLAGFNVDADVISELKKLSNWKKNNITPESISASYARISRDPNNITELRKKSIKEIESARESNERIIFGFGHHSIAEHAVINFDVINISRLAVEEIQRFRFASFTEKSQRYITLDNDFFIPEEFNDIDKNNFKKLIKKQNEAYLTLYNKLQYYLFHKHGDLMSTKMGERTVDGWAKEDARYVVSLATMSQFGMTVNARTLELMLKRWNGSNLKELHILSKKIYSITQKLCPSVIRFTEPSENDISRNLEINKIISGLEELKNDNDIDDNTDLIYTTPDADNITVASILFQNSNLSYKQALDNVNRLDNNAKKNIIKAALSHRNYYDNVDRNFEMIDFIFELKVSATNYAQLKRHRITTQLTKDYDLNLGFTTPSSIIEVSEENLFNEIMEETGEFYNNISERYPHLKNYILTNAYKRRVTLKLNARELYHFIHLREDEHAQWDIRESAKTMRQLAEKAAPLTMMMLSGKSDFESKKKTVFED